MRHIDLFSGIAGWEIAAQLVWGKDYHALAHSEIEDFPCRILHKHFPESECLGDIKKIDFTKFKGRVELFTASPPCQPVSVAGNRRGKEDDRWLWPQVLGACVTVRPRWAIIENPTGIISMGVHESISYLEAEGFEVETYIIPACAVGACHRRDRVWLVASYDAGGVDGRHNGESEEGQESKFGKGDGGRNARHTNSRNGDEGSIGEMEKREETESAGGDYDAGYVKNSRSLGRGRRSDGNSGRKGRALQAERSDSDAPNAGGSELEERINDRGKRRPHAESSRSGAGSTSDSINNRIRTSESRDQQQEEEIAKGRSRRAQSRPGRYDSNKWKYEIPDWSENWYEVAAKFCRVDARVPNRVDRLRALGNAIVPQIAAQIMTAIKEVDG